MSSPINYDISFGNTTGITSFFLKVNSALDGGFALMFIGLLFVIILAGTYKSTRDFVKGMVISGFSVGFISFLMVLIGALSWNYVWIPLMLFIMAFVAKGFE